MKLQQHPKLLLKVRLLCTLSVCGAVGANKRPLSLVFAVLKSSRIGEKALGPRHVILVPSPEKESL